MLYMYNLQHNFRRSTPQLTFHNSNTGISVLKKLLGKIAKVTGREHTW